MKRVLMVCFIIFCILLSSCANQFSDNLTDEDFEVSISVDKTTVTTGESVIVRVTIENKSSKDIKIKLGHTDFSTIEDMIQIKMFKVGDPKDFIFNSKGGPLKKFTFKENQVITKEINFEINEIGDLEVQGILFFYTGTNYEKEIILYSDSIKILVKE